MIEKLLKLIVIGTEGLENEHEMRTVAEGTGELALHP